MRTGIGSKTLKYVWLISAALLLWKLLLWIDMPEPSVDGVWSLSHVFSFMQGYFTGSIFAHSHIQPYLMPSGTLILFPFYATLSPLFEEYSIFLVNIIVIISNCFLIYRILPNRILSAVLILCYLTNAYTYSLRLENWVIAIILLSIFILFSGETNRKRIIAVGVLAALGAMFHLVGGVIFGGILLFLIFFHSRDLKNVGVYILSGTLTILFLYGPVVAFNYEAFTEEFIPNFSRFTEAEDHKANATLFLKYLVYGWSAILLLVFILIRHKPGRIVWIYLGLMVITSVLITFFGRSYYFSYLIVLEVLILMRYSHDITVPKLIIPVLLIPAFLTHVLPTIQQVENRSYVQTFKKILKIVDAETDTSRGLTWVDFRVGMVAIDNEQARAHYARYSSSQVTFIKNFFNEDLMLAPQDEIFILNLQDTSTIFEVYDKQRFTISPVIKPAPGLLTATSLFTERSDELGLWRITLDN